MQYLQEDQFYQDLYDIITVKDCLSSIELFREILEKDIADKKVSDKEAIKAFNAVYNLDLYYRKGERYLNRKEHLNKMIEKDKKKQEFFDNSQEPQDIYCNSCNQKLYSNLKILEDYTDEPLRVLFYFPCKNCKKKRVFYNTGEEYVSKPELCQKCEHELVVKYKKVGKKVNTIRTCTGCDFSELEIDNFEENHKKWEKERNNDKQLLEKYRNEFCLSEKEGLEYLESKVRMTELGKMIDEYKLKKEDPAYQKAKKLNKLNVVELEKLLVETLEKEKYIKLVFDKPEMGQHVIIPFTVQEANGTRKEYDTTTTLKKLLKNTLENTNWRLMSEGVSYRLGYVYGRLKGYEREEDLANLVRTKNLKDSSVTNDDKEFIY